MIDHYMYTRAAIVRKKSFIHVSHCLSGFYFLWFANVSLKLLFFAGRTPLFTFFLWLHFFSFLCFIIFLVQALNTRAILVYDEADNISVMADRRVSYSAHFIHSSVRNEFVCKCCISSFLCLFSLLPLYSFLPLLLLYCYGWYPFSFISQSWTAKKAKHTWPWQFKHGIKH